MIPAGHRLGHAARYTNGNGLTIYGLTIFRAGCACGLAVYGPTLPKMWAAHDVHLGVVRAMSKAAHPSNRRES